MDEHARYAFSAAADTSKQVIFLATGALAVEIAFAKDLAGVLDSVDVFFLEFSWVCMLFSILMGLWALMAIAGGVAQKTPPVATGIYEFSIRVPMVCQLFGFIFGLFSVVVFAMRGV